MKGRVQIVNIISTFAFGTLVRGTLGDLREPHVIGAEHIASSLYVGSSSFSHLVADHCSAVSAQAGRILPRLVRDRRSIKLLISPTVAGLT